MPRYLVTGAMGFIGSNLVRRLCAEGAEVLAIDSLRTGRKDNLAGVDCEISKHDVTTPLEFAGQWDAVFHHGDITDPRYEGADIFERNVGGFRHVLEFCRENAARLVYASTAGLYGNGPVPMREDQELRVITEYGRSKQTMEELGREWSEYFPVVGLRYFNVFGPYENHKGRAASMVLHLAQQIHAGQTPRLFKHGEQSRDFIYVSDVVQANVCALTAPSGVYNVGTGEATSFNRIVEEVARSLEVQTGVEYFDMPYDPATYQTITQAETGLARTELGFIARWSIADSIADYVRWMKEHGALVG